MKGTTFLVIIVVLAMMMSAAIGSAKIDKKTAVGIWLLDGKDLSYESSDNHLEGTVMGKPKSVEGQFGKAMSCSGAGEYVDVTPNDVLDMGEQVTITLWIQGNAQNGWHRLVDKRHSAVVGWEVQAWNAQTAFGIRIDTNAQANQCTKIDGSLDGEWHHIAFVLNDGKVLCFKDAVKVQDRTYQKGKGFSNQDKLTIGSNSFKGIFDEVAIFNVALDDKDITDIMEKGLENILGVGTSVSPSDKTATTWADIKQ